MQLNAVDIIGGFYADETLPWSAQKTVNWLPEVAEVQGTRTISKFRGVPGLALRVDLGTNKGIRGAHNVEGTLYIVSAQTLYRINTDFTSTVIGSVPGVSRVSMTHTRLGGTSTYFELSISNGFSNYVLNTQTGAFAQVTDPQFLGATVLDAVDGYTVFTDAQGRFWGHSDLNQATSFTTFDRNDAESAPDRIVSLIVINREVMVFGARTTEFFRNTGAATGTFQRVDGTEMNIGIAAPFARAYVDNTVYWLGHNGSVYRLDGHSPTRVSSRPIEQQIRKRNAANCFAEAWDDDGHAVVYFTFPDGETFGYDLTSQLWHQRKSHMLKRWRINTITEWNGMWIAGDYTNGKLYQMDWSVYNEDGRPLIAERVSPPASSNQNRVKNPYVELIFDTGREGSSNIVPLTISGDMQGGFVGSSAATTYTAAGGFSPYTFAITVGALPSGATMSAAGVVTGNFTMAGVYSWTVTVTDAFGQTASLPDTATVLAAPAQIFEVFPYTGNGVAARTFGTLDMSGGGLIYTFQPDGSTSTGGSYAMRALPDEYILGNQPHNASITTAVTFTVAGMSATQSVVDGFNTNATLYTMTLLRRVARVFDMVFYTGNGANRTVAHGLGLAPGMYTIFRVAGTTSDQAFQLGAGANVRGIYCNGFGSEAAAPTLWNNTAPTSTEFSLGTSTDVNANGVNYVALLFAHDTDPNGYMVCGSYTGNGSVSGPTITTGWAPRAVMTFPATNSAGTRSTGIGLLSGASDQWRGIGFSGGGMALNGTLYTESPTGLTITSSASQINQNGIIYRYVAIR